ncbi:hypothetical protein [Streptomyces argenteolus]
MPGVQVRVGLPRNEVLPTEAITALTVGAAAARLARQAGDASLPHPVPAVLAEADTLAALVDDVAARFPIQAGALEHAIELRVLTNRRSD